MSATARTSIVCMLLSIRPSARIDDAWLCPFHFGRIIPYSSNLGSKLVHRTSAPGLEVEWEKAKPLFRELAQHIEKAPCLEIALKMKTQ